MSLAGENVWLSVAMLRLTSDKRPEWRGAPLHVVSSAAGSSENFPFGVFICRVIVCVFRFKKKNQSKIGQLVCVKVGGITVLTGSWWSRDQVTSNQGRNHR